MNDRIFVHNHHSPLLFYVLLSILNYSMFKYIWLLIRQLQIIYEPAAWSQRKRHSNVWLLHMIHVIFTIYLHVCSERSIHEFITEKCLMALKSKDKKEKTKLKRFSGFRSNFTAVFGNFLQQHIVYSTCKIFYTYIENGAEATSV